MHKYIGISGIEDIRTDNQRTFLIHKVKEGDNKSLIKPFCFCKTAVKCITSVTQYVYTVIFLRHPIPNCHRDFVKHNARNTYFCELCYFL